MKNCQQNVDTGKKKRHKEKKLKRLISTTTNEDMHRQHGFRGVQHE